MGEENTVRRGLALGLLSLLMLTVVALPAMAATRITIPLAHYDARGNDNYRQNINDEYIVFKNNTSKPIRMGGWKVNDRGGLHVYRFPQAFKLGAGKKVALHTGKGRNGAGHLYWGQSGAVWNNDGDTVTLRSVNGVVVVRKGW